MRLFLIDDEPLAIDNLQIALEKYPHIEIAGTSTNPQQAIAEIKKADIDVLFLDIQMPEMDGFELLEELSPHDFDVVFVTAYDNYALQAFEAEAMDYLLKPVTDERLERCLNKLEKTLPSEKAAPGLKRLFVREGSRRKMIPVETILSLEAQGDYVAIKTTGEEFLMHAALARLSEQLESSGFRQIHRSFAINLAYLKEIRKNRLAVLKNGSQLPVSRSGLKRLKEN